MKSSVVCVDIGGTTTKVAVVDPCGEVHSPNSFPTRPDAEFFFTALCDLLEQTLNTADESGRRISGIGIAVAGFLSAQRDRLIYNPNLNWLEEFPLLERLSQDFKQPIELETDSNSACMAERFFGSGRHSQRFLCVTAGTGLGVGMAVAGEPLRVAYGCLGDMGHIIVEPGGPVCACGGRGCAETLISAPVLAQEFAQRSGRASAGSLRDVIDAAHAGDTIAHSVLTRAGEHLGIAIASMANILFPDRIAIAGGLSAAGDCVVGTAEETFRGSASTLVQSKVTFGSAQLGSAATLIGAAWPFWKRMKVQNNG